MHENLKNEIEEKGNDKKLEYEKVSIYDKCEILGSNTVINPWTVMIINNATFLTYLTMFGSRWSNQLAIRTYVIILIIL